MKILRYLFGAVIVLALVGIGGFVFLAQSSQGGSAPGLAAGTLLACPDAPNCVSSEMETPADKAVEPLPLGSWAALPGAVAEMGGTLTVHEDDYIAAEFSSDTFGFVDDLELRLDKEAIQVRSASRVGYSDAGVNAARVSALRKMLAN
ncbi:MAG: DUF1499 domain-containing protein [Pseudomonadota bacterium]